MDEFVLHFLDCWWEEGGFTVCNTEDLKMPSLKSLDSFNFSVDYLQLCLWC